MFRRQIFQAVTFILIGIVIFLLLRGRNTEREWEAQNIRLGEVATESSSPVRAILPRDLEIVETDASWTRYIDEDENNAAAARHSVTVRNNGGGFYVGLWLRLEYVNENGTPVDNRTHEISGELPPGSTLRVDDITIDGLPDTVSDFHADILSADMELYPEASQN